MIIYGGQAEDGSFLNDAWVLEEDMDGSWRWTEAPNGTSQPIA